MDENKIFTIDKDSLIDASKPLFYGFVFLSGMSMMTSPSMTGTFLGVAIMAAITFIAAGISDTLDKDWRRFMEMIAVMTLLGSILAAGYIATMLSYA